MQVSEVSDIFQRTVYAEAVSKVNRTFCDEMLCNVFVSYILFLSKMSVHYIHMFLRLTKPEVSFIRSHEYGHLK